MEDAQSSERRFNEPRGHGDRYSKIERIWKMLPSGYSIKLRRTERFDPLASLLYSPIEYIGEDISSTLPTSPPDENWIGAAFTQFVHGEFGHDVQRPLPDSFEPVEVGNDAIGDAPRKYLQRCESELVYTGILQGLNIRQLGSIEEGIYHVLTTPLLGNPANRRFLNRSEFTALISPSIKQHKRIQFVLPGFPFKDQNIFRTEAPPDHIDLGDIALLIRLHTLALAFFQIHPYGADWIILADGVAYAESLGIDVHHAESYRENLRDKRNALNLQGTVTILDLDQVAKHTDGVHYQGRFESRVLEIQGTLSRLISTNADILQTFHVLARGIAWNLDTRRYENKFSKEEIWHAVTNLGTDPESNNDSLTEEIHMRSEEAALRYAAYNLALRWHQIPQCVLPDAFRATVHPKAGQVAVPSLGSVYPWNGIPLVHNITFRSNDILTVPWCEYRKPGRNLLGHAERASLPPLYYTLDREAD